MLNPSMDLLNPLAWDHEYDLLEAEKLKPLPSPFL